VSTEEQNNPEWRARIQLVGKENFEIEEMIRLGFLENSGSAETLTKEISALAKAREKLIDIEAEIAGLGDIEHQLDLIRSARIERVKREREFTKQSKALISAAKQRKDKLRRVFEPTFFGRGVSGKVHFSGGDSAKIVKAGLPDLTTFVDIARWLELKPTQLQWLTYHREALNTEHYIRFEIPKRNGGARIISSPKPALKLAQGAILRGILDKLDYHTAATAFRPGLSIVDNAKRHIGANVVVKMDLKDFFPSIHFDVVRDIFARLGYNGGVATVLALLCTESPRAVMTLDGQTRFVALGPRSLPQGASTSPSLANQAAKFLDLRLTALGEKTAWVYSRYADDLIFSSRSEDASPHRLLRMVERIIRELGFTVNSSKTRVMRSPNRQTVTGLLVNETVKLTKRDSKRIRAFLHQCRTKGLDHMSAELGKDAFSVARGYFAYVHMVLPEAALKMLHDNPWLGEAQK
jgi:retron-type reverse transcriptase